MNEEIEEVEEEADHCACECAGQSVHWLTKGLSAAIAVGGESCEG